MGAPAVTAYALDFSNPALETLHSQVIADGVVSNPALDRALPAIDYRAKRAVTRGNPDLKIQSAELFQALTERPQLWGIYRKFSGETLPWEIDASPVSQEVVEKFDEMVSDWRASHPRGTDRELAERIYRWLTDPQGLGMVYDTKAREQGFADLVKSRRGDCTEFTFALLALYGRVGFAADPQWVSVDLNRNSVVHVATQLRLGADRFLVDPVYQRFDAPHQTVVPMSRRELLACYWNNRAMDVWETHPNWAELYFDRALQIDPANPYFYVNRADYFLKQGRPDRAKSEITQALKLEPNFPPAQLRRGNEFRRQRDWRQARLHYQGALAGNPQLHNARTALIEVLIYADKIPAAQSQLAQLRKLEPTHKELGRLEALIAQPRSAVDPLAAMGP
jgi:hypothetical protein